MKKIVVASFALALAALQGCSTPCDDAAAAIQAKNDACGVEAPAEGEGEGEAECSEADGIKATCTAACFTAADCIAISGSDDFDATSDEFAAFVECLGEC
jgi:hypothetical protein